jgi:hypothetical protein
MRLNGHGPLSFEDARTWIEETGLCLFLPKRQPSTFIAPSFVEAVAGRQNPAPDPKQIALAEQLLVRLETEGVAVRLNLLGLPGEQPDFVVAAWVLPYVYALRGDRDWRRSPQLTGSRQVSPLAIQAYKLLETGDATVSSLKHTLGREVSESAVLRAITELWQQLRIIPVIAAPGQPAKWQLLRTRFQKAIAEGASTSQVTAISVLASIYLQAVIAAPMEDVELFLAPLTARSKVREVLRGLLATRQVHTIALGHAPHFYVAGTLPEFAAPPTLYSSASISAAAYFLHGEHEEEHLQPAARKPAAAPEAPRQAAESHPSRIAARKPVPGGKSASARPHFSRPASHSRDRKPAQSSLSGRSARRPGTDSRSVARSAHGVRSSAARPGSRSNGSPTRTANGAKSAAPAWNRNKGRSSSSKPAAKSGASGRGFSRNGSSARKNVRAGTRANSRPDARPSRKPALAASARAGNSKRYGFTAPSKHRGKKRG